MLSLFKGFWEYISNFEWWQGLIIITVMLVIFYLGSAWKKILPWLAKRATSDQKWIEYKMFWGIIRDAMRGPIKDEIRRSFRENGIEKMSGQEFSAYVKSKVKTIMSILRQQVMNFYPHSKTRITVPMSEILNYLDTIVPTVEDVIFDVFVQGKSFVSDAKKEQEGIDEEFAQDINRFVEARSQSSDKTCGDCVLMLFGKREIVEQKKSKISVLREQMTFAEQKLQEIETMINDHYSEAVSA